MFLREPSLEAMRRCDAEVAGFSAAIGPARRQGSLASSVAGPLPRRPSTMARRPLRSDLPQRARSLDQIGSAIGASIRLCSALLILSAVARAARSAHIALWRRLNVPS